MPGVSDVDHRTCRGCGARFERTPWALDVDLRASPECWHACSEVGAFQLEHPDEILGLHQLVVDTYGVQHVGEPTPPIRVVYGLVGLHLALDIGIDGPGVRDAHTRMGKPKDWWPTFAQAPAPAVVTVADVLREGRDAGPTAGHAAAVHRWAGAVWAAWAPRHDDVVRLTARLFPGRFGGG
jgi:hypothetical protein